MRKIIIKLICFTIFFTVLLLPVCTYAATPLNPSGNADLTLYYQKDGKSFPELQIEIYRVAEAFPDGTFELIEPFASFPISIHDITRQEQWANIASTLNSYIVANQIVPDRTAKTNDEGIVFFENLKTGLYFVSEVMVEDNSGTYIFNQFLVYVPTPLADGSYDYSVEAKPKCTNYIPKNEYRVTKLWQDMGNQNDRPEEIEVEIYKDGILQETQVLNAENNWSYIWYTSSKDNCKWTVTEKNVPENYTVTIQQNDNYFSIINTHKENSDPSDNPHTGDTFILLPWIMAMCFSGFTFLIIGAYRRRQG